MMNLDKARKAYRFLRKTPGPLAAEILYGSTSCEIFKKLAESDELRPFTLRDGRGCSTTEFFGSLDDAMFYAQDMAFERVLPGGKQYYSAECLMTMEFDDGLVVAYADIPECKTSHSWRYLAFCSSGGRKSIERYCVNCGIVSIVIGRMVSRSYMECDVEFEGPSPYSLSLVLQDRIASMCQDLSDDAKATLMRAAENMRETPKTIDDVARICNEIA